MIAHLVWVLAFSALHLRGRRRGIQVARAHHEVRGPLATARLALGGLERTARVEAIDLELRRAALALDDLAGSGRGRRHEAVDLGRLLADAAPAWRAFAARHGGTLTLEGPATPGGGDPLGIASDPPSVPGDPLRLAQACANLITNAIEHGGGSVDVRVARAGPHVRVHITDAGPGLPASLPALLAAARGRRCHRGHGLAIAAAIARSHGGRLISAPADRGAHLVLELPAAARVSTRPAGDRAPRVRRPPAP